MSEDISKLLTYIEERERNLSRCSDKLRRAIAKIEDVFGNQKFCQRCGYEKEAHEKIPDSWLEENKQLVRQCLKQGGFVPKIQVSIVVIDDEPFYQDEREKVHLAIDENHWLRAAGVAHDGDINDSEVRFYEWLSKTSREKLKALIRSKRLIPFLQKVAEELKKAEREYSEVAEVAEKMAEAIS